MGTPFNHKDYSLLLEQFIILNKCKTIVELGVQDGHATYALCRAAEIVGGHVYGFDIWGPHGLHNEHPHVSQCLENVKTMLESYGFTKFTLTKIDTGSSEFSDILKEKTNGSIDFAFIDAGHSYTEALRDLKNVYPLLSKNAIVAFHDTHIIDGCRELMLDLRTKYYDGTYDIIDMCVGADDLNCGLSFLVKRQYPDSREPIVFYGSPSTEKEIVDKELTWYNSELEKYSNNTKISDVNTESIILQNVGKPVGQAMLDWIENGHRKYHE